MHFHVHAAYTKPDGSVAGQVADECGNLWWFGEKPVVDVMLWPAQPEGWTTRVFTDRGVEWISPLREIDTPGEPGTSDVRLARRARHWFVISDERSVIREIYRVDSDEQGRPTIRQMQSGDQLVEGRLPRFIVKMVEASNPKLVTA